MTASLGTRLMQAFGRSSLATLARARRRPIIFVHIPKTAGTAFSYHLKRNCGRPGKVLETFYGDYSIYDGVTDVHVILGHTHFRDMLPRFPDAAFVTWLRNPLERVISQYKSWHDPAKLHQHWKDNVDAKQFGHIYDTQKATFEEFALSNDPRIVNNISNTQTTILSHTPAAVDPQRALASAIENLEQRFAFLGIVERFNESMTLFDKVFECPIPFEADAATANRSAKIDLKITDRAVERIVKLNEVDQALYEHACRLLDNRLNRPLWPFRLSRAA